MANAVIVYKSDKSTHSFQANMIQAMHHHAADEVHEERTVVYAASGSWVVQEDAESFQRNLDIWSECIATKPVKAKY